MPDMPLDHPLIQERIRKLEELRKAGIEPYPHKYGPTHRAAELQTKHASLAEGAHSGEKVRVAGRLMLLRDMGKVAFGQLQDATGRVQVMLRRDIINDQYDLLKLFDLGDFLGVEGEVIKTKTGEITVLAKDVTFLAKSIRPLPDKYHGLQDEELRFRKRYLDLAMNPEVREIFAKRAKAIHAVRDVLQRRGFLEVETPALQTMYGGANARPFITHINAWDMKMYLSISPELYLKRLIVGGYEKVYTICKNFRNEGVDQTHNPEFTMMECYAAYWDYHDMMVLTEEIYEAACIAVNGSTKVVRSGVELDFKRPWLRIRMKDAIREHGGIDVDALDDTQLRAHAKEAGAAEGATRGEMILALFEHHAEPKLIQPCHIIDHPIESTPLCKTLRAGDRTMIERFESFAMGTELSNAYSELNDPILQRRLLEEQAAKGRAGDEEAHPMDEDFIQAIEHGMPPTGGLGIGIDRMVIFLTAQEGIRDVILFPTVRPQE